MCSQARELVLRFVPLSAPSPPLPCTGAKALTMKQAIVIAAICEFGGAVLLVSHPLPRAAFT